VLHAFGYAGDRFAGEGFDCPIGRFGVGYDAVDVGRCTERRCAGFTSTAGAVDRPVAEAVVGWISRSRITY